MDNIPKTKYILFGCRDVTLLEIQLNLKIIRLVLKDRPISRRPKCIFTAH